MFRSTARRATPQPTRSDERTARHGRHHRADRDREVRDQQEAVRRARRRASQVDAYEAVSGPLPAAAPAQRSAPTRPEPVVTPRIDNITARQDPLTRPFPSAPDLPDARRSPSAPMRAPAHATGRS
jgi:hypothetical protein